MNPRARDASLGDSNRSSGDQDMTLQSLSHVETMWKISELTHRTKQHPDDFPKLPDITSGRYTSEAFFRLAKARVWYRTRLVAGRAGGLPCVGSFRTIGIKYWTCLHVREAEDAVR